MSTVRQKLRRRNPKSSRQDEYDELEVRWLGLRFRGARETTPQVTRLVVILAILAFVVAVLRIVY